MTFTRHEVSHYDIYVNNSTGKVHHAVDMNVSEFNQHTLYPYEAGKYDGLDNVCDTYTLQQIKNRLKTGKIVFR